jgi:hypothetical protein
MFLTVADLILESCMRSNSKIRCRPRSVSRHLIVGGLRRYDLLCLEGLSRALRIFLGEEPVPVFRLADPGPEQRQRLVVKPEVRTTSETLERLCHTTLY